MNKLELVASNRLRQGDASSFTGYTDFTYDDFVVDGVPLRNIYFGIHEPGNVTYLQHNFRDWAVIGVSVMLGEKPSELSDGRVPIYVCPECGDLGCGALTVDLVIEDNTVTWKRPGWQDSLTEEVNVEDCEHLADLEPFVFDREEYESLLRSALDRYTDERKFPNSAKELKERFQARPPASGSLVSKWL